jgi:hypothetical protein
MRSDMDLQMVFPDCMQEPYNINMKNEVRSESDDTEQQNRYPKRFPFNDLSVNLKFAAHTLSFFALFFTT